MCSQRKSENRADECLLAQERLHPDCARRPERYPVLPSSPVVGPPSPSGSGEGHQLGTITPSCHQLADECRAHPDCKPRLEFYVQACAVDLATKGCAGPPSVCRRAVLDILGTDLRTTCTCRTASLQADLVAMYDCVEWQRLLWLNPCVGRRPLMILDDLSRPKKKSFPYKLYAVVKQLGNFLAVSLSHSHLSAANWILLNEAGTMKTLRARDRRRSLSSSTWVPRYFFSFPRRIPTNETFKCSICSNTLFTKRKNYRAVFHVLTIPG